MHTHARAIWLALALILAGLLVAFSRGGPAAAEPTGWPAGPAPFGVSWLPRATLPANPQELYVADPVRNRLYLGNFDHVQVIDAGSGAALGTLPLPAYRLFIAPDGSKLYATAYTTPGQIAVFDAATLAPAAPLPYACPAATEYCVPLELAVGPAGRLYVVRPDSDAIDILDPDSGAVLNSFAPGINAAGGAEVEIHDDILVLDTYQGDRLATFDISALDPVYLDSYLLPMDPSPLRMAPDGAFLAAQTGNAIYQFAINPLALTRVYQPTPPENGFYTLSGISPDGHILSIVRPVPGDPWLIAIDAATGHIARSLGPADAALPDDLRDALVLAGGEIVTVHNSTFVIRRPIDHAAAVPLALANACLGGAILDQFNDPASGWPTQVTPTFITSYVPGAYRFFFSDPGQWVAVTRGDVWHNAESLQVIGHLIGAQYGTFGLVYGVNAGWSDFYSFEILPYSKKWYLFHFHDGAWELLDSAAVYVTESWTYITFDRNDNPGEIDIKINGIAVTTIPEFTGRVGLVASSLWQNIEAHFYNYEFIGDNCVKANNRLAPAEIKSGPELRLSGDALRERFER